MNVSLFADEYRGRKVLVTGYTGFKGSWLVLWLKRLGAEVSGIALGSVGEENHWAQLHLDIKEYRQDIRDAAAVGEIVATVKPNIVFHLAAQSLVRESYHDPLMTWSTNVQGTVNILDACRIESSVKAVIVVTSDKCYENLGIERAYAEDDRLGGYDPYSASKAATELVASSYRRSFFDQKKSPLLATARAGNVIGGGDWSDDRLIPDLIRAEMDSSPLEIRSPYSTRPWQHVLDALAAYLLLGQNLLSGKQEAASAWNFGPDQEDNKQVIDVLQMMQNEWPNLKWCVKVDEHPHEAHLLNLNSSKAKELLRWSPVWDLNQGIKMSAEWYRSYLKQQRIDSETQLETFIEDAQEKHCCWAI